MSDSLSSITSSKNERLQGLSSLQQRDKYSSLRQDQSHIPDLEDGKITATINNEKAATDVPYLPWYTILIVIGVGVVFVFVASKCHTSLPRASTIATEASNEGKGKFIAERAHHHLRQLVSSSARVSGSHENEVFAANVLTREVNFIKQRALPIHKILLDVQKDTGCTFLGNNYGYTSCFAGITNIVVKLSATETSETSESLLLSCHFDSAPKSPGASAASQCAIMLELLQILSRTDEPIHNSVVFLFNGAKESYQQGALSFVTKHPWAKNTTAVINLDAFGVGGREMLFQQGLVHPKLLEMYSLSVPYPHGLVLIEELFNSFMMDNTDYRIFTEIGTIPGLGFATFTNGYVYRTAYDIPDKVSLSSLQHTGDNMLALVKSVLYSKESLRIEEHTSGVPVYYDVFGLYIVRYSECSAVAVNLVTVCLGIFVFTKQMKFLYQRYGDNALRKHFRRCMLGNVVCPILGILITNVLARIAFIRYRDMSWYSYNWMVYPCFYAPVIICQIFFALNNDRKRNNEFPLLISAQIALLSQHLTFIVILVLGTLANVRSSYLLMIFVLFPSIAMYVMNLCFCNKSRRKWIVGFLLGLLLPLAIAVYHMVIFFETLIPAYGRLMQPSTIPGIKIAGMSAIWCSFVMAHLSALVVLVKRAIDVWCVLIYLRILLFVLLCFTSLMPPFVMDPEVPSVLKVNVIHTERTFYHKFGGIQRTDSGYWVIPADQHSAQNLVTLSPNLVPLRAVSDDCERKLYCAMPVYEPQYLDDMSTTFWVKAQPPVIHSPTSIELEQRKMLSLSVRRLKFVVKGPDHIVMVISPLDNCRLIRWSFSSDVPVYNQYYAPALIVTYTTGMTGTPLKFWMDFQISEGNLTASSVNIVVVGHYMHSNQVNSNNLNKFLQKFPSWIHVTSWTSTYKVWSF